VNIEMTDMTPKGNANHAILVVGGTGTQGGNVARELLSHGHSIRVLTRDPDSDAAVRIGNLGAEIARGDMEDIASLEPALEGIRAVFSVQYADPKDFAAEKRRAAALTQAMKKAGVRQVIHTSAANSDKFPRYDKHDTLVGYWDQKWEIEEYIRNGGFEFWTILHPCYFMENFAGRLAEVMNPEIKDGVIFGALKPNTRVELTCGEDTAAFVRGALENREKYDKHDIQIASESLTLTEIAEILTEVTGKKVSAEFVSPEEAVKRGLLQGTVHSHDHMNDMGFGTDIEALKKYGIPLTPFKNWALRHKDEIMTKSAD
jgi:uncharacterized protein YbjT (DUF2867 family)